MPKPIREIPRREALARLGAAGAAMPLLTWTHHPLVPVPQGESWAARALTDGQLETLLALAEQIIPETDTPGAKGAMVHQYIDWVVSEDDDRKVALLGALAWFEDAAQREHGRPYADVGSVHQVALLQAADGSGAPGREHFEVVKQLTVEGYYRSEVGMRQELGYAGREFVTVFEGCQHPEHHAFDPVARDAKDDDA